MPALAPNSLIAITGITGYIGSHVGLKALQDGHRVRGTVRSLERAKLLKAAYAEHGVVDVDSRLEFVVVTDLGSADQYQKAIKGVDGIVHTALDISNFLDPSFINTPATALRAFFKAVRAERSIRRVVVTSSSVAVISGSTKNNKIITDQDWNDDAIQNVGGDLSKVAPMEIYAAAKTLAEKAAWEFMQKEQPQFDLVTLLPDLNTGPVLSGKPTSTAEWVAGLFKNDPSLVSIVPPQWYIDVRDTAKLHVLALTTPILGGRRIWAGIEPYGWNNILATIRKNFPHAKVPDDFTGSQGEVDPQKFDNTLAIALLGNPIPLEQSLIEFGKSIGY